MSVDTITSQNTAPQQQNQQKNQSKIENLIPWFQKRIEQEHQKGSQSFQINRENVNENENFMSFLKDSGTLDQLVPQLESLGLKVERKKDPGDYESLFLSWNEEDLGSQDEGDERFEVPQEETEEETETRGVSQAPVGATGGRQNQPTQRRPGSRRIAARLRVQPRPPELKIIEVGPIQNLRSLLENVPVQRIAYENWIRKRLVLVGNNQPLERALSRINKHNILSLPVVEANSPMGSVVGLLDVLDIVDTVSEAIEAATRPRRELLTIPINNIMSKENRSQTYLISTQSSLYDAVNQFAQYGVPRAMIVDRTLPKGSTILEQTKPEDRVVGLLTQSDILRFLAENYMWMNRESIFKKPLRDLGLGSRKPVTVDQNMPAYQAFMEIHRQGRDGVAMVDSNGKILQNLSASNIKGMTRTNFQLIFRPLSVYLSRDRKRGWWHLPVCTTLDTTLEQVILQFIATKVHRMYVTDQDGKPIGEVNLTDVMKLLYVL